MADLSPALIAEYWEYLAECMSQSNCDDDQIAATRAEWGDAGVIRWVQMYHDTVEERNALFTNKEVEEDEPGPILIIGAR